MKRLTTPWLVSLPFMAAGCLAAHSLAYHLVSGREQQHGYLAFAPLVLGLLGALAVAGVVVRGRSLPPLACAALPPLAFVVQEHVERLELVAAEPAFLAGLALQLPFALAALVAARAFLGAAERVLGAVTGRRPPVRRRLAPPPAVVVTLLRSMLVPGPCSSRAPPPVA